MTHITTVKDGTRRGAKIVTRAEFNALMARLEDVEDALTILCAQAGGMSRDAMPAALVARMLKGEHPLRLWREQRGMTLAQLSKATKVAAGYLNEIENGKKPGSAATLKKCAAALQVDLDDLVQG